MLDETVRDSISTIVNSMQHDEAGYQAFWKKAAANRQVATIWPAAIKGLVWGFTVSVARTLNLPPHFYDTQQSLQSDPLRRRAHRKAVYRG
jgi:hypothetical protein